MIIIIYATIIQNWAQLNKNLSRKQLSLLSFQHHCDLSIRSRSPRKSEHYYVSFCHGWPHSQISTVWSFKFLIFQFHASQHKLWNLWIRQVDTWCFTPSQLWTVIIRAKQNPLLAVTLCYDPMIVAADHWGAMVDVRAVKDHHSSLSSAWLRREAMLQPVQSFTLSNQDFLCLPLRRLPSTVPWSMVLDRDSWRETWPYQASLRRFAVARSGSCLLTWVVTFCLT